MKKHKILQVKASSEQEQVSSDYVAIKKKYF